LHRASEARLATRALYTTRAERYRGRAGQAAAGAEMPSRKVRTPKGRVVERSTRGNPRESATETNRLRPPSHVNGGPARVKWCGKSAPASRRRGGWANPTRCKVKADRSQVARRDPGRPRRWMAAQRQNPAYRPAKEKPRSGGVFLWAQRRRTCLCAVMCRCRREMFPHLLVARPCLAELAPPGWDARGGGVPMGLNCAVPPE
jgi:hypothetical protein